MHRTRQLADETGIDGQLLKDIMVSHPRIFEVIGFLELMDGYRREGKTGNFLTYQMIGMKDAREYLRAIHDGNPEAQSAYESIVNVLRS